MTEKSEYKSISEWRKADPRAFNTANRMGWLDIITDRYGWEKYVKRTTTSIDDIINSGADYDTYIKWRSNEKFYYRKARKRGVVNKICNHFNWTFSEVGSSNIWTMNLYLESISTSKSKSFDEWKILMPRAFRSAYKNKKLDEISNKLNWVRYNYKLRVGGKRRRTPKKNGYWINKQRCLDSALNFESSTKWADAEPGAQGAARKHGWYKECTAHMFNRLSVKCGYWNKKSRCLKDALLYNTRSEWCKHSGSAYISAKRNGWYEECCSHMAIMLSVKKTYTKEECLIESLLYTTKREWRESNISMYNFTNKQIWREECFQHMIKPLSKLSLKYNLPEEECIEIAKKCKNIHHFAKNHEFAYKSAKANGFLEECKACMYNIKDWTYEECFIERKKWSGRTEWRKKCLYSYNYAKKMDWVDSMTIAIKGIKPTGWWNNKQRCLDSALEFNRIIDWTNKYGTAVTASRRNGWFEECTTHMVKRKIPIITIEHSKEECLENAKSFLRRGEWFKKSTTYYHCSKRNGWYEECTAHMVRTHKNKIK